MVVANIFGWIWPKLTLVLIFDGKKSSSHALDKTDVVAKKCIEFIEGEPSIEDQPFFSPSVIKKWQSILNLVQTRK